MVSSGSLPSRPVNRPMPFAERWRAVLPRRRPVLGVSAAALPPTLYVVIGVACGPAGLSLLSGSAVATLDLAVTVALVVLGIYMGLATRGVRGRWGTRLLLLATLESLLAASALAGGLYWLFGQWRMTMAFDRATFAMLAAVATAASAVVGKVGGRGAPARVARLAGLADMPLVIAGAVLLMHAGGGPLIGRTLAALAASAAVALAGHLLFQRATDAERPLFLAGTILLLGGIGTYLHTSPLLTGLAAAVLWVAAPGPADRITADDLARFSEPLIALLLVIAGASIVWSIAVLWIGSALVVLRLAAKLLSSVAAARLAHADPVMVANVLLRPGIIGIAIALNAGPALGAGAGTLLGSVTLAVIVSEGATELLLRHEEAAR
jgi:hypothetical protein